MFTCLVLSWNSGLCASAMDDWLSMWMVVGSVVSYLSSLSNRLSHTASFAACPPAMYSASVLDRATALCFLELQLVIPPPSIKTYPEVDFLSFLSLAQSASAYPFRTRPSFMPLWKVSARFLVPCRYLKTLFSARVCSSPGLDV